MQGMKVGVMRQTIDPSSADAGVLQLFANALHHLTNAGTTMEGCQRLSEVSLENF